MSRRIRTLLIGTFMVLLIVALTNRVARAVTIHSPDPAPKAEVVDETQFVMMPQSVFNAAIKAMAEGDARLKELEKELEVANSKVCI